MLVCASPRPRFCAKSLLKQNMQISKHFSLFSQVLWEPRCLKGGEPCPAGGPHEFFVCGQHWCMEGSLLVGCLAHTGSLAWLGWVTKDFGHSGFCVLGCALHFGVWSFDHGFIGAFAQCLLVAMASRFGGFQSKGKLCVAWSRLASVQSSVPQCHLGGNFFDFGHTVISVFHCLVVGF